MNIPSIPRRDAGVLGRRDAGTALPLLQTATFDGAPATWPGEKLERLMTPREIELVVRGRL